ncbi:MAG: baseplate J/gp47 family protein [Ktedonobacteraceae bacterium]
MTKHREDEIRAVFAGLDTQESQDTTQPLPEERQMFQEDMQDVYVLIVREQGAAHEPVVQSTPMHSQQSSLLPAYAICLSYLFLVLACTAFQCYCILNPTEATVTIIPAAKSVTVSDTVRLGRVLSPLTISQAQLTQATGKGHQEARVATGSVTFYNGQFQDVTIAAGTIVTGGDGIAIMTDQDVTVPAANPPSFGQASVSARATSPGARGNIPADDINQVCCADSVLAKNTTAFSGGQDARTYTTVTQNDIHRVSTLLKTGLASSITGAFRDQLRPQEQLSILACSPTVASDRQPGDEATQVRVTVSESCSAVAYNSQDLETQATAVLSARAVQKVGTGCSLFGAVHVSVQRASVRPSTPPLASLSFTARGTWVYGISSAAQERIRNLIAGKTLDQAEKLLASLPGVKQTAIRFSGFGDENRLPKQSSLIHFAFLVI